MRTLQNPPGRRAMLRALGAGAVGLAAAPLMSACTPTQSASTASPSPSLLPAPEGQPSPLLTEKKVNDAVGKLDGIVGAAMSSTAVPGVAVGVVYRDKVVYLKGFGVREAGKQDKVGPDTVFQVASVSKPIASTVIAALVGRKAMQFADPLIKHNPRFALSDPYVTEHATFEDLLSHRGGLATGAGDLLEDLGFDQAYILAHLSQQPLDAFRASYNYSNFGYTEAGVAAAAAMGKPWEDVADEVLFTPLKMTSTSYRHADYLKAPDRALLHVRDGQNWVAKYSRDPDAEAPAGGASSSVRDLVEWIRLQLGNGTYGGQPVVDSAALAATHVPQIVSGPPSGPAARTHFYGMGWNVGYDAQSRLQLGHSGAFNLGAATSVAMLPGEQLGIVVLTNGQPDGIPEAISSGFLDVAQNGAPTVDWLPFTQRAFQGIRDADKPTVDYTKPPAQTSPAKPASAYTGTYANPYYGPITVADSGGSLAFRMGPEGSPTTFQLTHYTGDTFTFASIGENANGLAGAIFTADGAGPASSVRLDYYDTRGLGTFTRKAQR